jgi:hypothetical protein
VVLEVGALAVAVAIKLKIAAVRPGRDLKIRWIASAVVMAVGGILSFHADHQDAPASTPGYFGEILEIAGGLSLVILSVVILIRRSLAASHRTGGCDT